MIVNSLTSVSLAPPLVSFCAAHTSSTWPRIQAAGAFSVNVLAEHHSEVSRLFAQKGYHGTSIGDIAEALGVQKGSLYSHIASKEDLLYSVIHEVHLAGRELVERNSKGDLDTITQLRNVALDPGR